MNFLVGLLVGAALDPQKVWAWVSSLVDDSVPLPKPPGPQVEPPGPDIHPPPPPPGPTL